jgi:hypothetical protein
MLALVIKQYQKRPFGTVIDNIINNFYNLINRRQSTSRRIHKDRKSKSIGFLA